jgi:exopolysaccharide biosynthesis polyprenyl glycosylphosphotransferase
MPLKRTSQKSNPWQLRLGERQALLLVVDFLMAVLALVISLFFWGSADRFPSFGWDFILRRVPIWYLLLPAIWVVLLVEIYDVHRAGDWAKTVRGVSLAVLIGVGAYLLLYFYYVDPPRSLLPRRGMAAFVISATVLTLAWRRLYIRIFTASQFMRRVLLVGGGRSGQILLTIIQDLWPPPFYLVGIIDDDLEKQGKKICDVPVVGNSQNLQEIINEQHVSDIIVAISGEMQGQMFQSLLDTQELGVEITRMPVAYEEMLGRVPIRILEADWILRSFVDQARVGGFFLVGKRMLDILGGLFGLGIMLVVLPFVSLMILLDDGFPVFYLQTRSGKGGQPYQILKFRTMRRDAEADGKPQWAKEDDERATRSGRLLRRTHLDELPQFLNVLRGDMSLVGPRAERPELVDMFQRHVPFYRARLMVKPGITGWAQVNFGYASTIDETITKLEYDLYYIKHRSIFMDLLILLRTPSTMFGFRGR